MKPHNAAPEIPFETIRPLIEKGAISLVTFNVQLSLPIDDWIDLARYAHKNGITIEEAILQCGVINNHVMQASDDVGNDLRDKATESSPKNRKGKSQP